MGEPIQMSGAPFPDDMCPVEDAPSVDEGTTIHDLIAGPISVLGELVLTLEKRVEQLGKKLGNLERRVEQLDEKSGNKVGLLDAKVGNLEDNLEKLHEMLITLSLRMVSTENRDLISRMLRVRLEALDRTRPVVLVAAWKRNVSDDKKMQAVEKLYRLDTAMQNLSERLFRRYMLNMIKLWRQRATLQSLQAAEKLKAVTKAMQELREQHYRKYLLKLIEPWKKTAMLRVTMNALRNSELFVKKFQAMHQENDDELLFFNAMCDEFPQYSKVDIGIAMTTLLRQPAPAWLEGLSMIAPKAHVEQRCKNILQASCKPKKEVA